MLLLYVDTDGWRLMLKNESPTKDASRHRDNNQKERRGIEAATTAHRGPRSGRAGKVFTKRCVWSFFLRNTAARKQKQWERESAADKGRRQPTKRQHCTKFMDVESRKHLEESAAGSGARTLEERGEKRASKAKARGTTDNGRADK